MSRHRFQTDNQANRPSNKPSTVFPDLNAEADRFRFGLEAEFLIVSLPDYRPLWHRELKFVTINAILEGIDLAGIPGDFSALEVEPPHRRRMPYVVEGYHLPDQDFNMVDILPKGIEIRTPVCDSIEDCLTAYRQLHERLQAALAAHRMKAVNLSHHPVETKFAGPMNKRRYDFWQWAMEVMTTYGPDINVSVPTALLRSFDLADFDRKINYYAPALAAVSAASPFFNNDLWKWNGTSFGKSYRTFKRSITAPAIEYHADENNRFEFKIFEMTPYLVDFKNYFLLFLTVLLEEELSGRAEKAERVYAMGDAAKHGLDDEALRGRLMEVLEAAPGVLDYYRFDSSSLQRLKERVAGQRTLADELINYYRQGASFPQVLEYVSDLRIEGL